LGKKGKQKKKFLPKKNKTLIIVEGESDRIFINGLLRYLKLQTKFEVRLSGDKGHCDILRKSKINNLLKDAKADGYEKVYILIDFNTDCGDFKPSCFVELKNWYLANIVEEDYHNFVNVIVAIDELECWEVLGWKFQSIYKNCYQELKNIGSKTKIAQKSVLKLAIILRNCNLNSSFEYFLKRLNYPCE
jgi:hypothetical protein